MGSTTTALAGRDAEQTACHYLTDRGMVPVARNFRRRVGEIDIVMLDRDTIVFVEVRFRSSERFSSPELTVNAAKQARLIRAAALFLARNPAHANRTCRFDVVAVNGPAVTDCRWIRDAFRPQDASL